MGKPGPARKGSRRGGWRDDKTAQAVPIVSSLAAPFPAESGVIMRRPGRIRLLHRLTPAEMRSGNKLDGQRECGCIGRMKTNIFAILLGLVLTGSGCVSTVDERSTAGVPFLKDRVEGRYERTVDQVAGAAKDVIKTNGVLVNESVMYGKTNAVKTVERQSEPEDGLGPGRSHRSQGDGRDGADAHSGWRFGHRSGARNRETNRVEVGAVGAIQPSRA